MTTIFEQFFNRLKLISGSKTDADLARKLGISRSSIANWKSRERVDFSLIFKMFEHTDLNYLIKGVTYSNSKQVKRSPIVKESKNTYETKIPSSSPSEIKNTIDHKIFENNEMMSRIIDINNLPKKEQGHIYFTIDALIKSAKTKKSKGLSKSKN